MIYIQRKELSLGDFSKNMFNIGLHLDVNKLISFKLCMMIDMTKLYMLIPVWMTLTVLKVTGLQESWNLCSD